MRFLDIQYERIDFQKVLKQLKQMIEAFIEAETLQEEIQLYQCFDSLRSHVDSQYGLLYIRCHFDLHHSMYHQEMAYMQKNMPAYKTYVGEFYQSICESAFREEWDDILGIYPLAHIEQTLIQFYVEDPAGMSKVHQIMQDEEEYINQYETLYQQMNTIHITSQKRQKIAELEKVFDALIKKRNELAKLCGYSNYIQMYANSKGYDIKRNQKFHSLVKKYLLPLAQIMTQEDYEVISQFPILNEKESIHIISQIFHDLSQETGEFIDVMIENDYLQIHDENHKSYETYMIYLEEYQAPIVVSDYRNRLGVFHECGHAFQHYLNQDEPSIKRACLDYEINEAQALSMEFFVGYYIARYGVDDKAFRLYQLNKAINNICYDCMHDEFECMLYEHPEMTIEQRNDYWVQLEKTYFPHVEPDCRGWISVEQFFIDPFYNISYAYAQIVAMEFDMLMQQDISDAFHRYLNLCRFLGEASFEEVLHMCHMHSPLDEEHMKEMSENLLKMKNDNQ